MKSPGARTFPIVVVLLVLLPIGAAIWVLARGAPAADGQPSTDGGTDGTATTDGGRARPLPPEGSFRLREVTAGSGIVLENLCGRPEKKWIIEANGSGAGLLDYDLDGDLDVYIVNGATIPILRGEQPPVRNALYRNDGDWKFTDVTEAAGVGDPSWGYGCAVADIDNDGDPDIYVTNFGKNVLYRNRGDGTFEDVSAASGLDDPSWGESAAFGDIDNDGDLDLYLCNKVLFDLDDPPRGGEPCPNMGLLTFCGPLGLTPVADRLFRNDGKGRFTDVSEASGVHDVAPHFGLGVAFFDYDDDGRLDIYVANDSVPNFLFHNLGDGRFEEVAQSAGAAASYEGLPQAGMGVALGDVDVDGRPDILVTNFADDYNTLYWNAGDGIFMDLSHDHGLKWPSMNTLGWGAGLYDFDNDADLDIYIANGHVWPQVDGADLDTTYRQPDQLFLNQGNGNFKEASDLVAVAGEPRSSRGAAFGDLDDDGDIDVLVVEIDDPPTLLRNEGGNRGAWLRVRLRGVRSNREGAGARLRLTVGERLLRKEATRSGSYCSSGDPRVHFGLGEARRVDRLEILWPGGARQVFEDLPVNREIHVDEEKGILKE